MSDKPNESSVVEGERRGGPFVRALEAFGRLGNKLPDPLTLFFIFCILVVISSMIFSGESANVIQRTGETKFVEIQSLFSREGVSWMFTSAVKNFIEFAPLGPVLTVMIGIGVAEKVGLMSIGLKLLVRSVPTSLITASVVFGGVMSSMAADAGYVVLTPLGALIFASMGRHPLAGLAAAYAGVSGGFSANLLVTGLDPMLSSLTQQAAQIVAPEYTVYPTCNYYLMIASTFLITVVGTLVTTKIVEPMLGEWHSTDGDPLSAEIAAVDLENDAIDPVERRAFYRSMGVGAVLALGLLLLGLLPGAPLRQVIGPDEPAINALNPFFGSIEILITILFLVPAIVYGVMTKQIRNDKDVAKVASSSMSSMGAYIVLSFVAGQFIAYFNWTNIGAVAAVKGADLLQTLGLSGPSLIIGFMIATMFLNFFVGSASAKWAFMAPIFVPMMMMMGISPEMTQATYRIGDSVTNIISPLMPYLPIIIIFAQKYDRKAGMGTLLSAMVPYSIAFFIAWTILLFVWYSLGLPLGPGAFMSYVGAS